MKLLDRYGDISPHVWYMAIKVNSLRRDPLEDDLSGRRRTVNHSLLPTLHPVTGFLVEEGV